MEASWPAAAQRAVDGLGVEAGEVVIVRDHTGRWDVLQEMLLAIEQRGATPLPELVTVDYLQRLLQSAPQSYLDAWDQHRQRWMREADRVLVLQGESLRAGDSEASPEAGQAWRMAAGRLGAIEEERRLPFLLIGVPTAAQAAVLDVPLAELEEAILPALAVSAAELQSEIGRVLEAVRGGRRLTIQSGEDNTLQLTLGNRPWLDDDGEISAEDRERGGVVSNLPAGSVYTTVVEDATFGSLRLPQAEGEADVVLHFMDGEVTRVAAPGGDALRALFDRHTGDARRVGHIGIGLNPRLHRLFGWVLPDEHVQGCLFVSLGENRYMGGQNASSLNIDFVVPNATLLVDDRVIVRDGVLQIA